MAIGLGIVLLVLGLIFVLDVVNLPGDVDAVVATETLGWILIAAGALAIVLSLIMNAQRSRTTHIEHSHHDPNL